MADINIRTNLKEIEKKLSNFAYKQVPFATSQAINALILGIKKVEQENERKVLDKPTPFTLNSIGVVRASKDRPKGTVYMKPIAEAYMLPFEFGGTHKLNAGNTNVLVPVDKALENGYGNLPRGLTQSLKGRTDVFVGPVETKNGTVYGVWQRTSGLDAKGKVKKVVKHKLDKAGKIVKAFRVNKKTGQKVEVVRRVSGLASVNGSRLKLLIAFRPPRDVTQQLHWFDVAKSYVDKNFHREFGRALAKAMASAK
jgi:hypothetical protein